MKRRLILVAALLLGPTTGAYAQFGLPAAPAAAPVAANDVTVTNKCCSIWDFLGVGQLGRFINNNIFKSRLGQALRQVLSPLGRALGLGPSLLSDKFAKEPGAMGLASKLKKEELKIPLKVQAIRYLGTLDCNCTPEIVDVLLASLDDCAEVVRYEALLALHKECGGKGKKHGHCKKCHGKKLANVEGDCPACCPGCMCQKKVVERLNEHLLARDENGCLKEKSERVRCLATLMIEECLSRKEPPPIMFEEAPTAVPVTPVTPVPERAIPDPTPRAKPEEEKKAKPDTASRSRSGSIWGLGWMKSKPAAQEGTVISEEVISETVVQKPQTVISPYYNGRSRTAPVMQQVQRPVAQPVMRQQAQRPVVQQPVQRPVVQQAQRPIVHTAKKPVSRPNPYAVSKPVASPVSKPVMRPAQPAVVSTKPIVLSTEEIVISSEPVHAEKEVKKSRSGKKHLFGELFGY